MKVKTTFQKLNLIAVNIHSLVMNQKPSKVIVYSLSNHPDKDIITKNNILQFINLNGTKLSIEFHNDLTLILKYLIHNNKKYKVIKISNQPVIIEAI